MNKKNLRAFSLIEVMISAAIFVVFLSVIYQALAAGNRSWFTYNINVSLQQELRNAMQVMVRELREASNILITSDKESTAVNFYHPTMGIITYQWALEGENARKIIRKNESQARQLAKDIALFSAAYPTNRAVIIDMVASQKTFFGQEIRFRMKEKVTLRLKTGPFRNPKS